MIRKSAKRFSEKIMLKQEARARWRFDLVPSRSSLFAMTDAKMSAEQKIRVGVMKRIGTAAVWMILAGAIAWPASHAAAQSASPEIKVAQAAPQDVPPAPRRTHRPPTRLRVTPNYGQVEVYPRYYPGPDAVRECNATYVQEFRPSGTVIVPRMHCVWTHG
jgi:hypothetical protein